jgi:hypothetical protein
MTNEPMIPMTGLPPVGLVRLRPFHIYFPRADAIGCDWGRSGGSVVNAGWAHLLDTMLCHQCASHLRPPVSMQPPPEDSLVS